MKATRRFIAHKGLVESRTFKPGETIPPDWIPSIRAQSVVDEPLPHLVAAGKPVKLDPFPEYRGLSTVDAVINWCASAETATERRERASYALDQENAGKRRITLIDALEGMIG